jgi:cation diffusion facilitator CzcD-associated flavoprotein CzcO
MLDSLPNRVPDAASPTPEPDVDVLIIGAGFSGLAMAIRLQRAGFGPFLIVEKAGEVGGTWRDNSYPGAACDIPSHLYSLSFEPGTAWSRMYPQQLELQAYLREVADKHGLRPRIRFNTAVTGAAWDEQHALWRVETSTGETISARVLISGMGGLHIPAYPDLPGLERFQGRAFHSSAWDHGFELGAKRVAVIGTGASAIQFVPEIAPDVARLSVYQRTPPWILRKADRPITRRERILLGRLPLYRRAFRHRLFWEHEIRAVGFTSNPKLMRKAETMARAYLGRTVKDPELRRKLTPSYRIGCKRVLISNDYYDALQRPNVELVTDPIAEIRPHSILTADGAERPADALIYGTGFIPTGTFAAARIAGRGGVELNEVWRDGMHAYKGIAVAGFPNLFLLLGPNTGLGHNSMIIMIEAQVRYVLDCLRQMHRRGLRAVEVRPEVQLRFMERLQARMARTVWQTGGCRSWYQDEQGRNGTLWPASVVEYVLRTRRASLGDYRAVSAAAGW